MTTLKVITADDERPARRFLTGLLKTCDDVEVVGEAASGEEAIALIEAERPHLALLDLQMPEIGGLDVVRRLPKAALPLVAFVTAFDDYAIEAFELNAIDYLLKPVQRQRLGDTLARARERIRLAEPADRRAAALASASLAYERSARRRYAERIPVRVRDAVIILPVRLIASVVAEGELLHVTTSNNEHYTITHRLHALESRLDPRRFVRLSRGILANIEMVARVSPMPGGTYIATLSNGQELQVSRIQSRALRDTLLKL
ncbi:MAG: response regulator transcription factor [Acidobacteria bacterium]|nr:response regulator transcription factor [Acidobacteriota bacterium]